MLLPVRGVEEGFPLARGLLGWSISPSERCPGAETGRENYRKGAIEMGRLRLVLFMNLFFLFLCGLWTQVRLEEIEEAFPFPPGKNAQLVKKVCGRCHTAEMISVRSYDEKEVRRHYELMVSDPDPEQEKKVIEYLCTVLGFK